MPENKRQNSLPERELSPTELLLLDIEKTNKKDSKTPVKNSEKRAPDTDGESYTPLLHRKLETLKETKKTAVYKTLIFAASMLIFSFIGALLFLRPAYSDTENRELTKFPKFELEAFLNGEYFIQIDKWYSDTYPCRDFLISANGFMESLYGIRDDQIIGSIGEKDEIPDAADPGSDKPDLDDIIGDMENNNNDNSGDKPNENDKPSNDKIEQIENIYIKGDTAYEIYGFGKANSEKYAAIISLAGNNLAGIANVYDMITPMSYSFTLSKGEQDSIGASDGEAAIKYMYSIMGDNVKPVEVFNNMFAHKDEYLYFRTDHHWTALGAYYAYESYCTSAGIPAMPLDSFTEKKIEGFLGTLYSGANKPASLRDDPDTVYTYKPSSTNDITIFQKLNGQYIRNNNLGVISGVSNTANKYMAFLGGDHALAVIDNPKINDGSAVLVVKESYGNAFVPFLVDSYDKVYIVDYRHIEGNFSDFVKNFTKFSEFDGYTGDSLADFVSYFGIDDVLFLNTLSSTGATSNLNKLYEFVK